MLPEKTVLQLHFVGSDNKKHTFSFNKAVPGLTSEQLATAMATIADAAIFNRKDVDLYTEAVSAAYVHTTTQPVYNA